MSSQGLKRSLPPDEDSSHASRPRKRPGGASRLTNHDKAVARDVLLKRQQEREQEAKKAAAVRGVHDVVRQHYNAVPQRGRDWRKTESRIKGLRSFNNWVKSTIIHKFSPDGSPESGNRLRVLDLGCGKGGDLGKWQQAPQPVELLVGIDPAEVSVEQARERYMQMRGRGGRGGRGSSRIFDAEFYAQDAFGRTIGTIPIIRDVGFDAPHSRRGGGFDVVSMMFCMHYAFESEAKTRGMLQNVSGSLKKGGRFIGAIPSSDVIRAKVQAFYRAEEALRSQAEKVEPLPDLNGSKLHPNSTSTEDTNFTPTQDTNLTPTQDTNPPTTQDTNFTPTQDTNLITTQDTNLITTQDTNLISTQDTTLTTTQDADLIITQDTNLTSTQDLKTNSVSEAESLFPNSMPATDENAQLQDIRQASGHSNSEFSKDANMIPPQDVKSELPQDSIPAPAQEAKSSPARETKPSPVQERKLLPAQGIKSSPTQEEAKPVPSLGEKLPPVQDSKATLPQTSKRGRDQDSASLPAQKKILVSTSESPAVAEWGNSIYRVRFSGPAPKDGMFRPPFGWKYSYFMEEAVEEIPEYVVPWEAFRA